MGEDFFGDDVVHLQKCVYGKKHHVESECSELLDRVYTEGCPPEYAGSTPSVVCVVHLEQFCEERALQEKGLLPGKVLQKLRLLPEFAAMEHELKMFRAQRYQSQSEYSAMFDNLTSTQRRCGVLLEALRAVKRALLEEGYDEHADNIMENINRALNPPVP
jgi:hypothetical protein